MYQFSYSEVVDESPDILRAQERHAIDRVIGMLRSAQDKGVTGTDAITALYYLRRLWTIFSDDLGSPENELPEPVRAGLLSIGIWVNKEIDLIQSGKKQDLSSLIEINETIRDGLR